MAFFDNWRVQLASINAYNDESERCVQALEDEYCLASVKRQQSIFEEYNSLVNEVQSRLGYSTFTLTFGMFFSAMWAKSIELYPELSVIKCNHTRHAILACSTKEEQDKVLDEYLARTVSPEQ